MKIIGITGYIGSGKSTVVKLFVENGLKSFDSDFYVSLLNNNKKIIKQIKHYFPNTVINNKLNKDKLKQEVFKDYENNILILEKIYHPFIIKKIKRIIFFHRYFSQKSLILEVPLLFQTNIDKLCDILILVKSSEENQIKRVLQRSKINLIDLNKIMKKQKSYNYQDKLFNYTINTDFSLSEVSREVASIINDIK